MVCFMLCTIRKVECGKDTNPDKKRRRRRKEGGKKKEEGLVVGEEVVRGRI